MNNRIQENLLRIKNELPENVQLVVVSKYHSEAEIMEAYNGGQRIFGESKIQAMTKKYTNLPKDIKWHMIGHTQTNKVKYMAEYVSLVHSVDSLKLLREIDVQAKKHNRVIDFLFQIRIAQEETKFGLSMDDMELILASETFGAMKNICLRGLMGMATNTQNTSQIKAEFESLALLFNKIKSIKMHNVQIDTLSMGMSSDYHIAVSSGSTMVRIGSAVFE